MVISYISEDFNFENQTLYHLIYLFQHDEFKIANALHYFLKDSIPNFNLYNAKTVTNIMMQPDKLIGSTYKSCISFISNLIPASISQPIQ